MIKQHSEYPALLLLALIMFSSVSCRHKNESTGNRIIAKTPVTAGTPSFKDISDTIDFPAITNYLKKNVLKSSITGVIESINAVQGEATVKGKQLFALRTMEASAMKNSQPGDSTLGLKGVIRIFSPQDGVISTVSHQAGDFVQEGDELAVIADSRSLVFILEVPFEMTGYIGLNRNCSLSLPDNTRMTGKITAKLPEMNIQNQTVRYVVTAQEISKLPENLIASALIVKEIRKHVQVLPRSAVLGNETQTNFWVMKMINDSVAIKVPVRKGIENNDEVEVTEPQFLANDRILISGNYGLPDTAAVIVAR
ncbi:MAG: HlyD family efflux transporter periplasmic adaptor subunit [Bacteroidales bacterium]